MTAGLLASPPTRRKAVLDTCAVFAGRVWRDQFMGPVESWLGADGVAVLPGRVIAEMAHVAAKKRAAQGDGREAGHARRARLALTRPAELVGLSEVRHTTLSQADVNRLCRDNADLELVRRERRVVDRKPEEHAWVTVPGDADFEIAHTVRVLTGADHQAVLVTRDRDLKEASGRLGVALIGEAVPPHRSPLPGPVDEDAGVPMPSPDGGGVIRLLGVRAAVRLLTDPRLRPLGKPGETLVVLSSTLALAAQEAAFQAAGQVDERPQALVDVQRRLDRLIASGRLGEGQLPVHLLATPLRVYKRVAERVLDGRYAGDDAGRPWDMHTMLVLCAAEVLADQGHQVHLVDSSSGGETRLVAAARCWRTAGALQALVGASEYQSRRGILAEVALPAAGGGLDMSALLRRFGDRG